MSLCHYDTVTQATENFDPFPTTPEDGTTLGSMRAGTRKAAQSSVSHLSVCIFKSIVREAFETSDTCNPTPPPPLLLASASRVNRQIRNESIVPANARPASASARKPGTLSKHQASFDALK